MRSMSPVIVEQMAEDHYRDLVHLAQAAHAADGVRPVRSWRRWLGRVLVCVGVGVGLPRQRRAAALSDVRRLLLETPCGGRELRV